MWIYRRVLRYYRPFLGQTVLGLLLSLLGIGLNLLKPWPFDGFQFPRRLRFTVGPDDLQQKFHQHLWIDNHTRRNIRDHVAAGLAADVGLARHRSTDCRRNLCFRASDSS